MYKVLVIVRAGGAMTSHVIEFNSPSDAQAAINEMQHRVNFVTLDVIKLWNH